MSTKDCVMALIAAIGVALFFCSIGIAFDLYGRQETQRQQNCISSGGSWQLSPYHDDRNSSQEFECKMPSPTGVTITK